MADWNQTARLASPNERRSIAREHLGFYNAVVLGAVYEIRNGSGTPKTQAFDPTSPASFYLPLTQCVNANPYLSRVVRDADTEKPTYKRVAQLDLSKHLEILNNPSIKVLDSPTLEKLLPHLLDTPFASDPDLPHWRITVVPLTPSNADITRFFVGFSWSHALGDGMGAVAFHQTFRSALGHTSETPSPAIIPTMITLPEAWDTPAALPISYSYLLGPLAAHILPGFISRFLPFKPLNPGDANTWTGANIFLPEKLPARTAVKVIEIQAKTLSRALEAAREHDAKLTGVVGQIILRAVADALPEAAAKRNFVSFTAMNMRGAAGFDNTRPGDFAQGFTERHEAPSNDGMNWPAASSTTRSLAASAARLANQSMGLMRYVSEVLKWTAGKIGEKREGSWEVSNLGVFDGGALVEGQGESVRIVKAVFAQPANVTAAPLAFGMVAVKGRGLGIVVNWLPGALGVEDEEGVVGRVVEGVRRGFEGL